ncbi:protein FAM149B1 isoform X2 [Nematostella vectensis]|uniref:protein FAM149B1 isoform X2 n=1 Tax=Nematostella vectensis TaxID=45351 RepID=UPI0020779998|nr:protein FAM149B1 isoform X2 [Nematostella vectensis]
MTNRALPLEIRGFSSRGGFETLHPLPERPEESVPLSYLETVREAINSYRTSDTSGRSSPTTDHTNSLNNSLWASNSWSTNTGNLTGRSSVYSWGNDDEFDRQASATVQRMFDEINNMLFEGKGFNGSSQLLLECQEWCTKFPHLRICGVQSVHPQDEGTQYVPLPPDDPRVYNYRPQTSVLEDMEDISMLDTQGLLVEGFHLDPSPITQNDRFVIDSDGENLYADLEEEVIDEDGEFEEFFAYDCPALDEEMVTFKSKHRRRRNRRLGLPPVTPNACAKEMLTSQMFDLIWGEMVLWLRSLLSIYSQKLLRDKLPHYLPDAVRQQERAVDSPLRPISRDVSSRISHFPSQLRLRTATGLNPPLDMKGLKDVMMIKSLALQHRAPSAATFHTLESREGTPYIQARPGSSSTVASRISKFGGKMSEHVLYRLQSARTKRNPTSQRLVPLDRERPRTPNPQEDVKSEIVRGTKLFTGNDRLSSPPHPLNASSPQPWGARNGTLPPLDRTVTYAESISPIPSGASSNPARSSAKAKVHFNVRASSAATDDSRRSLREKVPSFSEARPNTTHSFRTDTPGTNRRLSTPMSNHNRGVLSSRQPLDLGGITGVSMSITAGHPSNEHAPTQSQHGDGRNASPVSDDADEMDGFFGHPSHPQRRGRLGAIR